MSRSCGILLHRGSADAPEVLLVHPGGPFWRSRDEGAWTIPKGVGEAGEDEQRCALREMREELGPAAPRLAPDDLVELGEVRQKGGKLVRAWAAGAEFDPAELASETFSMEWPPRSGVERDFPEVDRAEWFGPEEARRRIIPAQTAFLDRLMELLRAG